MGGEHPQFLFGGGLDQAVPGPFGDFLFDELLRVGLQDPKGRVHPSPEGVLGEKAPA